MGGREGWRDIPAGGRARVTGGGRVHVGGAGSDWWGGFSGSTLRIFQFSKRTLKILLKIFEPAFALTHSQRVRWFTVFKRINLMSQKVQHVSATLKFRELCVFDYVAYNTMHFAVNPANHLSHQHGFAHGFSK